MNQPYLTKTWGYWLLALLLMGNVELRAQACIDTFPYIQDFETSGGGWTAGSLSGGLSSWIWAPNIANPIINNAASGTGAWVTGNNPFLAFPNEPYSYYANEQSAVTSPCFDFSNLVNPGIQFNIWWESESETDGTVFQYSTDDGTTWTTLGDVGDPFNWYNDTSIVALNLQPGWSGDTSVNPQSPLSGSDGWVNAQRGLAFLAGQPSVRFRFRFGSDLNPDTTSIMDGFAFDDVIVADRPVVNLGNDTTLCFTQATNLDACVPGGEAYSWNTNPLDTNCVLTVVQTNTYIAFVTDTLGFVVTDTIDVLVSPTSVNLGPNQTICPGDTLLLDATVSAGTYTWTPGGQTTPTIEAFETGQYKVVVADTLGCVITDSVNILVEPVPPVDLGPDTAICAGSTIALNAGSGPPGTIYNWSPISASTQTVLIASPGTYTVDVVTPNGCTAADTVVIGVSLFPVVDLGPDRAVCDSITLDAGNPGATFQWSTSPTDTSQTYTVTSPGTYWVDVVNSVGCTTSDTVTLSITTAPTVSLGPDTFFCPGQSVTLDAGNPGLSYFWSNGDTTQTTTVSTQGQYIVRVSNAADCAGRDTIRVRRSTLSVNLGPDREICEGDSTVLDAGPISTSYAWSTGASTQTIEVSQAGTYTVTVQDTLGCEVSDDLQVTLRPSPQPSISISGNPVLFGVVDFAGQSTGNVQSWSWSFGDGDGANGQNASHTYVSTGSFTVCLTVDDGVCTRTTCDTLSIGLVHLEDHPAIDLALYPNPTDGYLHLGLDLPLTLPVSAALLDLTGRTQWQRSWAPTQHLTERLDLRALPTGLYLLRLTLGQETFVLKVQRR